MHGLLLSVTALFLTSTLAAAANLPPYSSTITRRDASGKPASGSDFHSTTRPRRVRTHHVSHKRSSVTTSSAKRTPIKTEADEIEERRLFDGLPTYPSSATSPSWRTKTPPDHRWERPTPSLPLRPSGLGDITGILSSCTSGMSTHQKKIDQLANRATKYKDSHMNSAFQNSVYQELKTYRGSAAGLPGLSTLDGTLKPLGPDQGLSNFNRNDNIEVLFRTLSTSLQDTLESIDLVAFQLPILGPVLGPIPYDIKCIIDDLLNIAQVVLDGLLNSFSPQLTSISENYLVSICRIGPSLPVC